MADKNLSPSNVMKDVVGFFKPGERTLIFDYVHTIRDKVIVRLLHVTGRRVSEVLMVRILDIDLENSKIAFNILKKKTLYKQHSYI